MMPKNFISFFSAPDQFEYRCDDLTGQTLPKPRRRNPIVAHTKIGVGLTWKLAGEFQADLARERPGPAFEAGVMDDCAALNQIVVRIRKVRQPVDEVDIMARVV